MIDETPPWAEVLADEVRKAGRAAVAARAAAEACEERVEALAEAAVSRPPRAEDRRLLEALLPVFDALDRIADAATAPPPAPTLWRRLAGSVGDPGHRSLRDGIALLRTQLLGALESGGVRIDREVNVPVDARRHRVVETEPARGRPAGHVLRILRPGYQIEERVLREAEVVATR